MSRRLRSCLRSSSASSQADERGLRAVLHRQCRGRHLYLAGTDEACGGIFRYALDPSLRVPWCARGGYGATRILPLDRLTASGGIPANPLVGYSDATLLEYGARAGVGARFTRRCRDFPISRLGSEWKAPRSSRVVPSSSP